MHAGLLNRGEKEAGLETDKDSKHQEEKNHHPKCHLYTVWNGNNNNNNKNDSDSIYSLHNYPHMLVLLQVPRVEISYFHSCTYPL